MKSHKLFVVSLLFWMLGLSVYAQQVSVNSADYSRNLSPGVLASAFGVNLALGEQGAASFPLPTEMGGTRVLVGGKAATLLYVSPYQINYQIPPDTAAGVQEVVVQRNDGTSFKETITVNQSSFGAFSFDSTGTGTGAILDARTFKAGPFDSQTAQGETTILALFGTGLGNFSSTDVANNRVHVSIGGVEARVLYAGPQNFYVGLDQINFEVPAAVTNAGSLPVVVTIDQQAANSVTVDLNLTASAAVSVAVQESFTSSTEVAALGVSPFADIDALKVTLRSVNLVTDKGVSVSLISSPQTLDLLSTEGAARLLSKLSLGVGNYTGMTAEISDVSASFKGASVAMVLLNKTVKQSLKNPLNLTKDTNVAVAIGFDVRGSVKKQTDGTYAFDPILFLNPLVPFTPPVQLRKFEGTVSAIDTANKVLTVTKTEGSKTTTVTVNVGNATVTTNDGKASSFSAIKKGDKVQVTGTLNSSGAVDATLILIGGAPPPPPRPVFVNGTIGSIDLTGKAITVNISYVTGAQTTAKTVVIKWDSTTKFYDDLSGPTTADKLKSGQLITAQIPSLTDPATASSVTVYHPHVGGVVTDNTGLPTSFVVTPSSDPHASVTATTRKITVTSSTVIKSVFGSTLKPSDITTGSQVDVVGDPGSAAGELTAIYVVVFGVEVVGTTSPKAVDTTAKTFVVTDSKGNKTTVAVSDTTLISVNEKGSPSLAASALPGMQLVKADAFLTKLGAATYNVYVVGLKSASGTVNAYSIRADLVK